MLKEFKEFALKGNVLDLAIGVIIGGAFGAVVGSLVNNVMMPPIGVLTGGVDFSRLGITLKGPDGDKPASVLQYGLFINSLITFLITAFAVFLLVKNVNRFRKQEAAAPAPPPEIPADVKLLTEIRDLLKQARA
ncbi:MAG: large conductance mechanosensitive channel [bacterium]|nr:MAG: large conductance mechanosensitive channel [bacterium]